MSFCDINIKYIIIRMAEQHMKNSLVTGCFLVDLKSATPFPKCYLHKEKWTFDS